ncbi:efflux RND transporter periplasmic adaptor subunit [Tichowtungia aerotolerans]|uniref:Efflux RND transporter periplasmic adaptor subunit n=1 Tax=Tichowtungia aerotolerans TaxID=2697043 RepID=A0A6P1M876_9BACT|nr:efflux RND transporter periplasmic adaptor subunit [Tichowtungia aerotolerans]QHI70087.1 efflux RND transporter periplasmic adaptor subunit [Tichowtungia aerotolerans]
MKPDFSKYWKLLAGGAVILIFAFSLGRCTAAPEHDEAAHTEEAAPEVWTCSMHPQIKLPKPGLCPICAMDLIPLGSGGEEGPRELTVSETAKKLMQIETVPVERRFAAADVRMVGKADYDETRTTFITSRMPGRLDRLFVDYTGIPVKKGDHLASIYSPELLSAQEELLQAIRSVDSLKQSGSDIVRSVSQSTVEAVREKLRLWGLPKEQIQEIEKRGSTVDHLTIYSPVSGIVIHKNALEGSYVKTGDTLYTVADLSRIWIQLEAYESDLPWLRYGQKVTFTAEALPGETFEGTIAFIDPVLNASSRTINVRVNVDNPQQKLKPGMFVRANAHPLIAEDGTVAAPSLAGKWISPMHPEIIKDEPGSCDVCGMPLVPAEELGYVTEDATAPLVIPATAPLITGTRAVVYIEVPGKEAPTYEGREITLGPKAGDVFIVRAGLTEGERVVTQGAFKLDAELQIHAKPSMMSITHKEMTTEPHPQTLCPVMGGKINQDFYADYNGMRIYFCCPGCETEFLADPEKHIEKMKAAGEEPEMLEHHHEH